MPALAFSNQQSIACCATKVVCDAAHFGEVAWFTDENLMDVFRVADEDYAMLENAKESDVAECSGEFFQKSNRVKSKS